MTIEGITPEILIRDDAAPRPWNWVSVGAKASGGCHVYLTDANGRKIGVIWGKGAEKIATIQKICDAINAPDNPLSEANILTIQIDKICDMASDPEACIDYIRGGLKTIQNLNAQRNGKK